MAFLNLLAVAEQIQPPGGLQWIWSQLILTVFSFISSYGWRIIVFTVCLKLLLFPLDIFQRVKMRKNQKITEKIAPQMEKLKEQFGHDKNTFAQKQMELNRREGFSYFSSCLPMIVTLVIFFWLFSGLNAISQFKNVQQYVQLYDVYAATELEYKTEHKYDEITDSDKKQEIADAAKKHAQEQVVVFYDSEAKESFLWISNIWSPDVPWTVPIKNYKDFTSVIGDYGKNAENLGVDQALFRSIISSDMYDTVTALLQSRPENKTNGFLILPILSVGLSFLSQFITTKLQKRSGQMNAQGGMAGSMKIMMIIMPLMMGFFALTYTAAFTLYIVMNSLMTIILNVTTSLVMTGIDKKKEIVETTTVQHYGRPDPNATKAETSLTRAERKAINSTDSAEQKKKTYKDILKRK